jgi:hypothetical protein
VEESLEMSQLTDNENVLFVAWLLHHSQRSIMRGSGFKKYCSETTVEYYSVECYGPCFAERGKVGAEVEDQATAFFSRSGRRDYATGRALDASSHRSTHSRQFIGVKD